MIRMIYHNDDRIGVYNTYIETPDGKWRSISQIEAYKFLRESKKKDIPIMLDGVAPFKMAIK